MSIKRKQLIITGTIILAVAYLVALGTDLNRKVETPEPVAPKTAPIEQNAEMAAYLRQLGIDPPPLNLVFTDNPGISDVEAQFVFPNTIRLYSNTPMSERAESMAHEYIHYVQYNDPEAKTFFPYLQSLYETDKWLDGRMEFYRNECAKYTEPCDLNNELEAIACTEIPDYVLEDTFEAWCYKHIPNRNILF